MTDQQTFADRMRTRYPEGLTGIVAIGGTRTSYVLEENRHAQDPGSIDDFAAYAIYLLERYFDLVSMFFDLGGQNILITALGYQRFYEKGPAYAEHVARLTAYLIGQRAQEYYFDHEIDPYFVGIDTLLHLPEVESGYKLAADLAAFQERWLYQEGRRKLIWEIASIPLFTFWKAGQQMSVEEKHLFEAQLAVADARALETIDQRLYQHYARAAYGTEIPMPHFYLGSNRDGDLKLRSVMPFGLYSGGPFRLFYTPYPSLFITTATFQAMLEDLAFGKPERSTSIDYSGQYTPEKAEAEYQRVMALGADPMSILGLTQK